MHQEQSIGVRDPAYWKSRLGLLPVPLSLSAPSGSRFVMLNGARGNFCLDVDGFAPIEDRRNIAWSSNVGHFVSLGEDAIEVKRWDTSPSTIERYSIQKVLRDLESFHRHLEQDAPLGGISVVGHSIRVFRRLRAVLGPSFDGVESLKAFLLLLASAKECCGRSSVDIGNWRLDPGALNIAGTIRSGDWHALVDELFSGRTIDGLKLDLSIVLTHAVGELFQEAHFEAVNIPQDQLMFEGFLPKPAGARFVPKIKGVHFTPPSLARTLVEEALSVYGAMQAQISIFDPACGSGEFLRESLRQIRQQGFGGTVILTGWDISEAACDMAKFSLAYEERNQLGPTDISIDQRDSLENLDAWPSEVDLILSNPPFVSWQDLTSDERSVMRTKLGALAKGRMDLSYAFLWGATRAVSDGGVLASIVPASFLDSDAASSLRQEMLKVLSPSLIARLGSHSLFARSLVDTGLFVAKKGETRAPPTAFWSDHRSSSTSAALRALRRSRVLSTNGPIVEEGYSIYPKPNLEAQSTSWAPRPYRSWEVAHELASFPRVQDVFRVRQGARTGKKEVFVVSEEQYRSLPVDERSFFRPAVINRSIRNGYLRKIAFAFYPYGNSEIATEEELREAVPFYFARFLLPNKKDLASRAGVDPNRWWLHTRHRAWQVAPIAKIVSTYFGDAGSFAWDSTGEYVVVQGLGWIPKKREYAGELPAKVGLAYLAILNSELFSELLPAFSNHVSGGQWNLSKKYVDQIPIPDLTSEAVAPEVVELLADQGEVIRLGREVNWEQVNSLVLEVLELK